LAALQAPVKAPFWWPNSSLSISDSGSAAQLMAMKRPLSRRGLRLWIACATSSLPTPLSPVTRTAALLGATWRISEKISCIERERPTRLSSRPL
jgi:hypothetical protein